MLWSARRVHQQSAVLLRQEVPRVLLLETPTLELKRSDSLLFRWARLVFPCTAPDPRL